MVGQGRRSQGKERSTGCAMIQGREGPVPWGARSTGQVHESEAGHVAKGIKKGSKQTRSF